MLNTISKPLLVDLLRTFDRNKWLTPRLRYASVRPKSELIKDLNRHFIVKRKKKKILMTPRREQSRLPVIVYDSKKKAFVIDGVPQMNSAHQKPQFRFLKGPYVLYFDRYDDLVKLSSLSETARRTVLGSAKGSPTPGTDTPVDFEE